MSNNQNNQNSNNEEVDLGQLFLMIGRIFSKFFNLIGSILKGLFHYFILLLLQVKKHFRKLMLAVFIGGATGFTVDFLNDSLYTYDMMVHPNYESIDRIYEKIEYYNNLIDEKDTLALMREFDLSMSSAVNLVEFAFIPHEKNNEHHLVMAYDQFVKDTDTITQQKYPYEKFMGNKRYNSKYYVYRIISKESHLKDLEEKIMSDIESSQLLQRKKRLKLGILKMDSIATASALQEIDSLRAVNRRAILLNAGTNSEPNTVVSLSDNMNRSENIELFEIEIQLKNNLISIERQKETSEEIVNILSSFNPIGRDNQQIVDKYTFKFIMWSLYLVCGLIILDGLNTYLSNYRK